MRNRSEGVLQTHEKVLLVTNIKVDGEPIGGYEELVALDGVGMPDLRARKKRE